MLVAETVLNPDYLAITSSLYRKSMKCKENCATAYSEERGQTARGAERNLLPDMQTLKKDLITHHNFVLHQEYLISLCLISRFAT